MVGGNLGYRVGVVDRLRFPCDNDVQTERQANRPSNYES